jgi:thiol:disulfide interchange protein
MAVLRSPRAAPLLAALAVAATAAGFGAALAARADAALPKDESVWREGAAGYRQAAVEAAQLGRPLLIYFRTDWCPYCRELERDLLSSAAVEGYLTKLARARINPESGTEEESLATIYGVSGYPALFLQRQAGDPPRRISRSVRGSDGAARLKTPQEFVAALQEAAAGR